MSPKCVACELQPYGRHCDYHSGYEDGYEAAQRERGPIEAIGKPLPPHFASETPQGGPGS